MRSASHGKPIPIRITIGGPHDGILHGDAIYFTTVDGHVVEVDATTLEVRRAIDLNAIAGHRRSPRLVQRAVHRRRRVLGRVLAAPAHALPA